MGAEILPDSRPVFRRGTMVVDGVEYTPIYCINCGKRYGLVPAKLITHVTALCDTGCSEKYGHVAHHLVDGDAKIRTDAAEVVSALINRFGRPVTLAELEVIAADSSTPLAAVSRDWHARVRKES